MAKKKQDRIGGSFAPPLTDELLAKYASLIQATDKQSQLGDALRQVFACAEAWWNAPESVGQGKAHPAGVGLIVELDAPIAAELFDVIPWGDDLEVFSKLFDGIDPARERELRNAAFHLLWHAKELELDREPLTADKL